MPKYDPLKQIRNIEITDLHVFSPDNETNTSQCLSDRARKPTIDHYQKDMRCTPEIRWGWTIEHITNCLVENVRVLQQKWVEVDSDYYEWLDVPKQ